LSGFICHGCGQGGDLIRFIQLSRHLSFRESLACLDPQTSPSVDSAAVLEQSAAFYRQQLEHYPEAVRYLSQRGLHDPALFNELGIGYAPGGSLRRYLTARGHSFDLLRQLGLLNVNGSDYFYQRIIFPLRLSGHLINLYGRSVGTAFAHRFLPGAKGGLYAKQGLLPFRSWLTTIGNANLHPAIVGSLTRPKWATAATCESGSYRDGESAL